MTIRKSTNNDIDRIMEIYDRARKFMAESGNGSQWTQGYPRVELVHNDILGGKSHVCLDGDCIVAVFYFSVEDEPTYKNINEGAWLDDSTYGVVHRIAVDSHEKGIASFCLGWCYGQIPNIRIDTHKNNRAMIRVFEKNGYAYCGIVHMDDGSERIAFQKNYY